MRSAVALRRIVLGVALVASGAGGAAASESSAALPLVQSLEAQPLLAQIRRLLTALDQLDEPLAAADRAVL